ncbi:MAG: Hsp33 family molecular chaperone HslO [Erysipelotrichaceae bacterium]|nr:Hsp33 family molecular chaperone HslO [Erysipelotrichaceae bacterium]
MNYLTRGTALNDEVRIFCCDITQLVQEAQDRHDLWPTAAAALGRTLAVGTVMGSMLKSSQEKIEIQINGKGPLGQIVVDCYYGGNVRGYVDNPHVYLEKSPEKLDVGQAVGTEGVIRVVKDLGMKQPFVSEVDLQTGELGDDFAYYYMVSEQTPSMVALGVLIDTDRSVKSAGALVIQLMPNTSEENIRIIEDIAANIKPISQLLLEYDSPRDIVDALFDDYKELGQANPQFTCECSRDKFAQVLAHLPVSDLKTMIEDDHGCEVVCRFCSARYQFSQEELEEYVRNQEAGK